MASPVDTGGFDYEFVPPLLDELVCSICHLAFREPVQTLCGHRFCRECLAEFHRRSRTVCPLDNQEVAVEEFFSDSATKRKILSSPVKCPNKQCDWIDGLSQVDNHKEVSRFEEVTCTHIGCTERVIRSKLDYHILFTCLWRNYECDHCKECFPFGKKEVHEEMCTQFPVKCTNRCDQQDTMSREKITRNQLDQHIKSSTQNHLDFACKKISELADTIQGQNNEIQHQNQLIENQDKKLEDQNKMIINIKADLDKKLKKLEQKMQDQNQEMKNI